MLVIPGGFRGGMRL